MDFIRKNKKLAPKYNRPAIIIEVNDSVAKLKMPNSNFKALNVNKLKTFFPRGPNRLKRKRGRAHNTRLGFN